MIATTSRAARAKHPRAVKRMRIWLRRSREQSLSLLLVVQLLILFVMPALRSAGFPLPRTVIDAVLVLPILLALVMARRRRAIAAVLLSVGLTMTVSAWQQARPDLVSDGARTALRLLPQLALLWVVSTAVFGRGRKTYHRILGAVVMYLAIGMIFVTLDLLLVELVPGAFAHLPADPFELRQALTYFSFSTLTTSSLADIFPAHPIARSLANIEAVCGQLFPAILLARVVAPYRAMRQASKGKLRAQREKWAFAGSRNSATAWRHLAELGRSFGEARSVRGGSDTSLPVTRDPPDRRLSGPVTD